MHNHTVFSPDSTSEPRESVERARELGLNGIAFTEHNSYDASEPVESLKALYKDILILRGMEYTSAEGHVLIFGLSDGDIRRAGVNAPLEDVIKIVNEEHGVVILPHPFREWSLLKTDIMKLKGVAAIEAYNGHNNELENERALKAASLLSLPTTGGSDSHNIMEVGNCFTEFSDLITYDNFLDVLRQGRYRGMCRDGS